MTIESIKEQTEEGREMEQQTNSNPKKRNKLIVLFIIIIAAALAGWYFLMPKGVEITDDAYVSGQRVMITSKEPGIVGKISVDDSENIQQGDTLVSLNKNNIILQQQHDEATLNSVVRQVKSNYLKIAQLKAELASQKIQLQQAQSDYQRRIGGDKDGSVLAETLAHAKNAVAINQQNVTALTKQLESLEALYPDEAIINNPQIQSAIAALRHTYLARLNSDIVAPRSGMIATRNVHVGQQIQAGQALMTVVPLDHIWIDANFKETQLTNIKPGQAVKVTSEIYGDEHVYHGVVAGINAGSGSAFSPIPAQNATGNWIKIVQRVPVRIYLDPAQLKAFPLRVGMSMTVTIDTVSKDLKPFDFKVFTQQDDIQKLQQQRLTKVNQQVDAFVATLIK
ncbi:efflux RND transporter periplasmic adaptor subunit [Vibrio sp. SS-MA-C1-2]|uniref:HlyD family secretion protein n=1 Tax=Vibrio sp. SS-MA-C1-2 TaxID=2908646 RepID=UPI001F2FDD63|nr:HlyD family efflux transporter periplasmic adaptor subunit [Vibrio sp. SS-MA-C1-2]UJF16955.1 efflux RND transporter periplasmic adaptor subunit [Vibrio sp. SS-MA-C1-2]